jgi:hypothetical protein
VALKEKVKTCFLTIVAAQYTNIVIKVLVLPSQQAPSTQSISEQKPEEKLVLPSIKGGPKPRE